MTLRALEGQRFVRKTRLAPGEYRKNFQQIDRDILAAVTSKEADAVTPLMSKVYLRLVNASERFWEREGVLRIEAELCEEKLVKAWTVLCGLVGVSSATASKALRWMHEQGIIGYFAGKNGVGLRIFLNRATSSIGVRASRTGEKILAFPHASSGGAPASADEPAFNAPFGGLESSDTDKKSRAPKNGAEARPDGQQVPSRGHHTALAVPHAKPAAAHPTPDVGAIPLDVLISRLRTELEPKVRDVARDAAAREHERTREWLENKGLPKAARVAQQETFKLFRKHGVLEGPLRGMSEVGRNTCPAPEPRPLSDVEMDDLAEAAVAMLETQGRPVEATLDDMSASAGGFLLPEDRAHVRARVAALLAKVEGREAV